MIEDHARYIAELFIPTGTPKDLDILVAAIQSSDGMKLPAESWRACIDSFATSHNTPSSITNSIHNAIDFTHNPFRPNCRWCKGKLFYARGNSSGIFRAICENTDCEHDSYMGNERQKIRVPNKEIGCLVHVWIPRMSRQELIFDEVPSNPFESTISNRALKQPAGTVIFLGDGPWIQPVFSKLIKDSVPDSCPSGKTLLILGSNYDRDRAREVVKELRRSRTMLYSQEIFLGMCLGLPDPYATPAIFIPVLSRYPHLSRLQAELGTEWPEIWANVPCEHTKKITHLPPVGPLGAIGYHVGKGGLLSNERRKLLKYAFTVDRFAQMPSTWGGPSSVVRLISIARTIARHIRRTSKHDMHMRDAIEDWESDFNWLRKEFYENNPSFKSKPFPTAARAG